MKVPLVDLVYENRTTQLTVARSGSYEGMGTWAKNRSRILRWCAPWNHTARVLLPPSINLFPPKCMSLPWRRQYSFIILVNWWWMELYWAGWRIFTSMYRNALVVSVPVFVNGNNIEVKAIRLLHTPHSSHTLPRLWQIQVAVMTLLGWKVGRLDGRLLNWIQLNYWNAANEKLGQVWRNWDSEQLHHHIV